MTPLAPIYEVDVLTTHAVVVAREPRHRCPTCLRRRVLYRIVVSGCPTGAQCAPCWGLR